MYNFYEQGNSVIQSQVYQRLDKMTGAPYITIIYIQNYNFGKTDVVKGNSS